jgi:type III restriction enzyme
LIFKLKTSDRPFALIKIGDISRWLKDKLDGYEINESYQNQSFFKAISEDNNSVNILMGSRAFYEGWDSNRPNVMIFINIGMSDAKKYVSQSIGRGVRIEPVQKKRKRLLPLRRENNVVAKEIHSKLNDSDVSIIETLFVLGTNKKNVQEILESIKYERKASGEIIELKENEEIKNKELLIPVYKDRTGVITTADLPKFEGNKELLSSFLDWLGDERLIYALFSNEDDVNPQTIEKSRDFIKIGSFHLSKIGDVYSQMMKLMKHVNITLQDLDKFKQMDIEIVHFKRIRAILTSKELERLRRLIDKVRDYKDPSKREKELDELLDHNKISRNEYKDEIKKLDRSSNEEEFTANNATLRIKYLLNHYYVPIVISEKEKINYINHIINIESEKRFMEQLESSIQRDDSPLNRFDWWMFCKLDEHLDEVFIPFYNKEHNKIEKFKPDFIFWLKKVNKYFIVFVDPKGTMHTDYEFKVNGYKSVFEENNKKRHYINDKLSIQVFLFLFTDDKNKLPEGYKKYWFDEFKKIIEQVPVS